MGIHFSSTCTRPSPRNPASLAFALVLIGLCTANAWGQRPRSTFNLSQPTFEYAIGTGVGPVPVRVAIRPAPWLTMRPGYCPIGIHVRPSAGKAFASDGLLTVRLMASDYYGSSANQWNGVIEIPISAGDTVADGELVINSYLDHINNLEIDCLWNGAPQAGLSAQGYSSYRQWQLSDSFLRLTLLSEASSQNSEDRRKAFEQLRTLPAAVAPHGVGSDQNASVHWQTYFADTGKLPQDWIRYGVFDEISADIEDLEGMDPSAWQAIVDYVWCGGTLSVGGTTDPERLRNFVSADWSRELKRENEFQGIRYHAGFGAIALRGKPLQDDGSPRGNSQERSAYHGTSTKWNNQARSVRLSGIWQLGYWSWLIPEVGMTPVWTFFAFVALVVGIGAPTILRWSNKANRRIWIVLAIPAMAIASTASLFLYAMIKDGWGSMVRIRSVTVLDARGDGATWSRQTYFAASMPGNQIQLKPSTELIVAKKKEKLRGTQYAGAQFAGESMQTYSGLLPLRQQRQFSITHPIHGLQCLQRTSSIDPVLNTPAMVNQLPATILRVVLAGPDGKLWSSADIPTGKTIAWTECSKNDAIEQLMEVYNQQPLKAPFESLNEESMSLLDMYRYQRSWMNNESMGPTWEESLWLHALRTWELEDAGKFVAFVESAPFVDRCLTNCREQSSLHVIIGRLEP